MVLARNELARRLRESETEVIVDGAFERLSTIIAEMRDAITRTRMPRAVLEAGLASAVLPPDKIARRIAARTEDQ